LDSDILISGHTHELRVSKYEGKYFLNPGSMTGAYTPLVVKKAIPSFMMLEFQKKDELNIYCYKLVDGKV
jgi:vacuolar protein sorting-associated protein 29